MEKLKLPKFKESELEFHAEWVTVMHPFAKALDKLQGENNTEAFFGAVLPTMMSLYKKLDLFDNGSSMSWRLYVIHSLS